MAMATAVALALLPPHAAQAARRRRPVDDRVVRSGQVDPMGDGGDQLRRCDQRLDARLRAEPRRHVPVPTVDDRNPEVLRSGRRHGVRTHETVDPSITFTDLDPSDAFYAAANIAVKLHWMKKTAAGTFAPDKAVTMTMVHRVLTLALGLAPAIKSLNHLHTADGVTFDLPRELRGARPGYAPGAPVQQLRRSRKTSVPRRRSPGRRSRTRCTGRRRNPPGTCPS